MGRDGGSYPTDEFKRINKPLPSAFPIPPPARKEDRMLLQHPQCRPRQPPSEPRVSRWTGRQQREHQRSGDCRLSAALPPQQGPAAGLGQRPAPGTPQGLGGNTHRVVSWIHWGREGEEKKKNHGARLGKKIQVKKVYVVPNEEDNWTVKRETELALGRD